MVSQSYMPQTEMESSVGAGGFESGNVNGFRVCVCLSLCPECEAVVRATWGTRKAKGPGEAVSRQQKHEAIWLK